jgi:hypothetical protein
MFLRDAQGLKSKCELEIINIIKLYARKSINSAAAGVNIIVKSEINSS